jgi:hypothetical protein
MKKVIFYIFLIVLVSACKKVSREPEGPTDIRIRNLTTVNMTQVTVNTGGGEFNFGTVKANHDSVTIYHRFDKAYPKANISAIINGQRYKTDTITSYAYLQYMGQMKATYEIWIESETLKKLAIFKIVPEAQLK